MKKKYKLKFNKNAIGFISYTVGLLFLLLASVAGITLIFLFLTCFIFGGIFNGILYYKRYKEEQKNIDEELKEIAKAKIIESGLNTEDDLEIIDDKTKKLIRRHELNLKIAFLIQFAISLSAIVVLISVIIKLF